MQLVAHDDVRALAQRTLLLERAHEPEQRVLALEDAGGVERTERAREAVAGEPDEHLRDAGTAAGDVHVRERALDLERERVGRLQLPGEADGEPDDVDLRVAEPRDERLHHVVVERIGAGAAGALDLLHRRQPEGRAVRGEVEVERMVRGRHDAERGVDRGDGAGVRVGIVERWPRRGTWPWRERCRSGTACASPRARTSAAYSSCSACASERLRVELAEPSLEPVAERAERLRVEQRVERLDVGVDRQDLDAVARARTR